MLRIETGRESRSSSQRSRNLDFTLKAIRKPLMKFERKLYDQICILEMSLLKGV